jgi:hypothetical protein
VSAREGSSVSQVWIELNADDPEASSALAVARRRLPAAAQLQSLRRVRVFELRGPLPAREVQSDLLHRSTRFYNPNKERCTLRVANSDAAPVLPGERVVLVTERGAGRNAAAERWWRHETGKNIEVREGTAWILGFERDAPAARRAEELAVLRDRRNGLLANPHAQEVRFADSAVPLPWLGEQDGAGIPGGDA